MLLIFITLAFNNLAKFSFKILDFLCRIEEDLV